MSPLTPFLTYAKQIPARTYYFFLAFVLVIYLALIAFQTAILTFVIPQDFTLHYLLLDVNNPNLSSMFFCHFLHNPLSAPHMTGNDATLSSSFCSSSLQDSSCSRRPGSRCRSISS